MPSEDSQFRGWGIGTKHKIQPISAKFPEAIDAILRDKSKIPQLPEYIRRAVIRQLKEDGFVND